MAMIEITNGEVTSTVPYAAYQSQYKRLGFRPVSDVAEEERVDASPVEVEHEASADVEESVEEVEDEEE